MTHLRGRHNHTPPHSKGSKQTLRKAKEVTSLGEEGGKIGPDATRER